MFVVMMICLDLLCRNRKHSLEPFYLFSSIPNLENVLSATRHEVNSTETNPDVSYQGDEAWKQTNS
jgi:hypothetical protein